MAHNLFDMYAVTLELIREQLATNPSDPNVQETHILDRQRKLILEKGGINAQINKYLDAIPITKERGDDELHKLLDKLEVLIGYALSPEEREQAIRGELESLKETLKEMDVKGTTIFFWDNAKNLPCIGDHMILGYLKASAEALGRRRDAEGGEPKESKSGKVMLSISYTQSIINQHVRVDERFLTFDKDIERKEDGSPQYCQRSLRAMTAKGPRISLARSEVAPIGAKLHFTLKVLKRSPMLEKHFNELFSYGELSGLGQWRNSGRGQFKYTMERIK